MKAQEILNLINKQWATKTDIAKIGQCGKDKAGKIKKIIEEELGDSFFLPNGQVPMQKVLEYFHINVKYLNKIAKLGVDEFEKSNKEN